MKKFVQRELSMRVVLDTNIFVSMTMGGQVGRISEAWQAGKFTLIMSDAIFSEYLDVLQRPRLHLGAKVVAAVLARVQRKAEFVIPSEAVDAVESDPTDNKFLEAALEGNAIYVVSGDHHLLTLKSFRNISIITAREFMSRVENKPYAPS